MSASNEIQMLEAEARYYRDRVALLRAKMYRQGTASSAQLQELERARDSAERRLRVQSPPHKP